MHSNFIIFCVLSFDTKTNRKLLERNFDYDIFRVDVSNGCESLENMFDFANFVKNAHINSKES